MDSAQPYKFEAMFSRFAPKPEPYPAHAKYNFIGGHNDPQLIPSDGLAKAASSVLQRDGQKLAIYNLGEGPLGYTGLRKFLQQKLRSHRGMERQLDEILVTSGSGQGIEIVNKLLVEPGDTVLMEQFTYTSAINKARAYLANVVGIEVDREGIRVDMLEEKLKELKAQGVVPKYIYTIPTIQNPTGSVLSLDRRKRIVELSRAYGAPIFEDECYADLAWAIEAPPAIAALAPEQVIHIGSFSKSLAPALRIGYATADTRFLARMLAAKTDGGTGALDQMIAGEFFTNHFDEHIGVLKSGLQRKLDVMVEALEREFGTDADVWVPQGGIFLWLKLPDHVDVRTFAASAMKAGVSFNAGPAWSCSGEPAKSYMRLCFALPSETAIREGIAVLADACFEATGVPARGSNKLRSA